jgi:hypothetical protein
MDSWNNEYLKVSVDGNEVYQYWSSNYENTVDVCGSGKSNQRVENIAFYTEHDST